MVPTASISTLANSNARPLAWRNRSNLEVIDGACKWDQNNSEQDDLFDLVKAKISGGIVIFIVGSIKTSATDTLAGCAGHAPLKPAVRPDAQNPGCGFRGDW
ncbi:MAG TPA: hypothetical protein P5102_13430 [Candidatus Competibacteraceae bacterium]|nr:hypothetical protein [Candidatus Competibacteraceae bacterium]HRZ07123.1 hypothetical protein [Candidatus Competibacteraceae bacterium]